MTSKTESYVLGMKAINYFYSMLLMAMRETLPGAQISQSGAFVWRGYRIDRYKELAYGQYYFQIYLKNPGVVLLQEGYIDPTYKATEMEKKRKIKDGQYYYPFLQSDDLFMARFFYLARDEQFAYLRCFVASAVEKALIWQKSDARKKVTKAKFQQGKIPRPAPVRVDKTYDQVGIEFLKAWEYQEELFEKLESILNSFPDMEWVRKNASIYNFGFRGLRLKFKSSADTSRWSVYFNDAKRLKFQIPMGKQNSYNLVERGYFDMSADEQTKQLRDLGQVSLGLQA